MSVELYFLINLIADMMMLNTTRRILVCSNRWMAWLAGLLCAGYAILAAALPYRLSSAPVQLALLALVSWMIAGRIDHMLLRVFMLLVSCAVASGGISLLLCNGIRWPYRGMISSALGSLLISLLLTCRHPLRDGWLVNLSIHTGGRRIRFPALIDTGNRVREPLSGKPVLIVEAATLRGALPTHGWRTLRFESIGGNGQLECFRPDGIWIEKGHRRQRAPDAWIAVTPEPLPGAARALAPCEFAVYST